jgi:hypothetical protein
MQQVQNMPQAQRDALRLYERAVDLLAFASIFDREAITAACEWLTTEQHRAALRHDKDEAAALALIIEAIERVAGSDQT